MRLSDFMREQMLKMSLKSDRSGWQKMKEGLTHAANGMGWLNRHLLRDVSETQYNGGATKRRATPKASRFRRRQAEKMLLGVKGVRVPERMPDARKPGLTNLEE